ncbi:MAG: EamA/RhaT family transporter, partial [Deltaproteobacteria bacterium]|nr:EamA/RhaT family transporter [Deltaproteobacteria bacterium]
HASITATLEPIIAAGISFVFLGETLGGLQALGGVLVIGSIILLQHSRQSEKPGPGRSPAK